MAELKKYIITLENKYLYREITFSTDDRSFSFGTEIAANYRLKRDSFFENFSINVFSQNNSWKMSCSDNVYFTEGDDQRLFVEEVTHGKHFSLRYRKSDQELLRISIQLDFEFYAREYDRFFIVPKKNFSIGTKNNNPDICIYSDYSVDEYIGFNVSENPDDHKKRLKIESLKSNYGILVNGTQARIGSKIKDTDFVFVADVSLYFIDGKIFANSKNDIRGNGISIEKIEKQTSLKYPLFNRNTRLQIQPDTEPIELLDPPAPPNKPKGNIIMKLVPALAMIALVVIVRGFMSNSSNKSFVIFSVCSMSIGLITSIVSFISESRTYKNDVKERETQYLKYIEDKKQEIEAARNAEVRVLNEIYYDAKKEIEIVDGFKGELYDRTPEDIDFMSVRIGKGNQIARKVISYKKQEAFATSDKLAGIPAGVSELYKFVNDAPITVQLADINALGIVGDTGAVYEIIKVIVLDLITRQYTGDLEIVLMIPEEQKEQYSWARWIPHLYNEKLGVRNIIWNEESRNVLFEYLYSKFSSRKQGEYKGKHVVVIAVDDWGIKSHPISQFIENAKDVNVSFIFTESNQEKLPLGCGQILFVRDQNLGEIVDSKNRRCAYAISHEKIAEEDIVRVSRTIAPVYCEEVSLENSLTKNITLYSLLNIYAADEIDFENRWKSSNIVKSMNAPIGVKTKDEIIYLDLHEKAHGPHGLVAGTTGSGKSEILQTYILSMATLFHPYEVGFVIIDFKGGGMVNQFKKLPHLIGAITNIDGKEIDRSLLSIKAELQKRQRLFAKHGVNNINSYIELYKENTSIEPLPHLILIVDEFAELKADQPEFMKELISASRIGRSLGVHLILATQKPSGQVSEQIWSNSRFKLCLKVQTREDSNEVIKSPLASEIKEPGRAYLQVGNNEIFELFQSAYSGAKASNVNNNDVFEISKVELGGLKSVIYRHQKTDNEENKQSQLEAIVDAVAEYCIRNSISALPNICLPSLLDSIDYPVVERMIPEGLLDIPLGIYDDPANQYQGELSLDISNDNVLIIGATQMGKTNLLQLIMRYIGENYSPKQIQLYIFDFASMTLKVFEKMNHVGGVVIPGDVEKIKNLFKLLRNSVEERKERLLSIGVSSYGAYVDAGYEDLPRIVVMMDNFAVFKELYEETYESEFQFLTREGPSYGVNFIVTNSRTAGLGYRYMANFGIRLALPCTERGEYGNIFDRCRIEPKETAGRILFKNDGGIFEAQTYVAFEGEREVDKANTIRAFIEDIVSQYGNTRAKCIPYVPENLSMQYMLDNYSIRTRGYRYPVALDYATVEIVWLNFAKMIDLCIIAREAEKRTAVINNLLQVVKYYAIEKRVELRIVDSYERPLRAWSGVAFTEQYTIDNNEIDEMFTSCLEELEQRQNIMKENGVEAISELPLLLYVFHSDDVLEFISDSKELSNQYQKITKLAKNLNVMFIFSNIEDGSVGYNSSALLKKLKENKRAIIGHKLDSLKMFDIPISTVRAMKAHVNGDVYLMNGNDIQRIRMVEK